MLFRITTPETRAANSTQPSLPPEVDRALRVAGSWVLLLLAIGIAVSVLGRTLVDISYVRPISEKWATAAFNTVVLGWPSLALLYCAWRVRRVRGASRTQIAETPAGKS